MATQVGVAQGFASEQLLTRDALLLDGFPLLSRWVTVTGQGLRSRNPHAPMMISVLPMGMVLGCAHTDGLYRKSFFIANDGSEHPCAILAESIDVSQGDIQARVYVSGVFHAEGLSWGDGHNLHSVTQALRERSLFIYQH